MEKKKPKRLSPRILLSIKRGKACKSPGSQIDIIRWLPDIAIWPYELSSVYLESFIISEGGKSHLLAWPRDLPK